MSETDQIEISVIPPSGIRDVWPHVVRYMEMALEHSSGQNSLDETYSDLLTGYQSLWVAMIGNEEERPEIIGAVTIRVIQYPGRKMLRGILLGGVKLNLWARKMDEVLTRYGRDNGCDGLQFIGRQAWARRARMMPWIGFRPVAVVMEKTF